MASQALVLSRSHSCLVTFSQIDLNPVVHRMRMLQRQRTKTQWSASKEAPGQSKGRMASQVQSYHAHKSTPVWWWPFYRLIILLLCTGRGCCGTQNSNCKGAPGVWPGQEGNRAEEGASSIPGASCALVAGPSGSLWGGSAKF